MRDVAAAASLIGLSVQSERHGALAAAFQAQLERVEAMEALGLDGVPPMIAFDPRWHD
jgi:hypothetical protein